MSFLLLLLLLLCCQTSTAQNYLIENAQVWNGENFEQKNLYISQGQFVDYRPAQLDSIIDGTGKYALPPFGDYHTHIFASRYAQYADSLYRKKGIFFAQDLVNDPVRRKQWQHFIDQAQTVDVQFANGCLTSNFGHPIEGYERMALGMTWPRNKAQRDSIRNSRLMEGRLYYIIDRQEELKSQVERLVATQPDVAKLILWHSEAYQAEAYPINNKGLNPALLPGILEELQKYRIPPVAHIETIYDLHIALKAGIRHFAHCPFYGYANDGKLKEEAPRLADSTIQLLKSLDSVYINPTLYRTFPNIRYLPEERQLDSTDKVHIRAFHRQLLQDLKASGAQLVAGADAPGLDAVDEILYYAEIGAFDNSTLLQMLISSSQAIFPERKIGRLEAGYEGHLLLLDKNPLDDIPHIKAIGLRIKNGQLLED